jgi:hypothetical protein
MEYLGAYCRFLPPTAQRVLACETNDEASFHYQLKGMGMLAYVNCAEARTKLMLNGRVEERRTE